MIKKYILEVKYWALTLLFAWRGIPYYVRSIEWEELGWVILFFLILILIPFGILFFSDTCHLLLSCQTNA